MKKIDRSSWVIGAGTLIGFGTGLIFLKQSALIFMACIMIGIGLGLLIGALTVKK